MACFVKGSFFRRFNA